MREVLFRGKRADKNEFVYGAFCPKSSDTPFGPLVDCPSIIKLDKPFDGYWFDVVPGTVGQYTGLEDVNGTKIFEGDIVDILTENEDLAVVEYGDAGFIVIAESFATDFLNGLSGADVEVVGNIYDNPEMISWER